MEIVCLDAIGGREERALILALVGIEPEAVVRLQALTPIELASFVLDDGGQLFLRSADGSLVAPDRTHELIAVADLAHDDQPKDASVRTAISQMHPELFIEKIEEKTNNPVSVLPFLLAAAVRGADKAVVEVSRRNVALHRSLAEVRRAHDDTQTRFAELEKVAFRAHILSRWLSTAYEPTMSGTVVLGPTSGTVEQLLSAGSSGFADFAVFIRSGDPIEPGAGLRITLLTADDNQPAAAWYCDAASLRSGWLRFSLVRSMGPDGRDLKLRLEWSGKSRLLLGATSRHPDPRWRCVLDGAPGERPLAVKTWATIPGIMSPLPLDGIVQLSDIEAPPLRLGVDLSGWHSLSPTTDPFSKLQDDGAILVHPYSVEPTIIRIPRACRLGLRSVASRIVTRSELGPRVDYAMAVAPALPDDKKIDAVPEGWTLSEWVTLEPMIESELHIHFDRPLYDDHDLYLLTRIQGKSNDYAWAHFREFNGRM